MKNKINNKNKHEDITLGEFIMGWNGKYEVL